MKAKRAGDHHLTFECPGCAGRHAVTVSGHGPVWTWNGSMDSPTLSPSVLVRTGHYRPGHDGSCWCTYNAERPDDPAPFTCGICHWFVNDGRIQFLSDCTHALAGQTVELPELESE